MSWKTLQIKSNAKEAETLCDLLLGLGAKAVTLLDAQDQPLLEPGPGETPIWDEVWVSGLLDLHASVEDFIGHLKIILDVENIDYKVTSLLDKNWTRAWLEHFHPMRFGKRLWVTPESRQQEITADNAVKVILDPGLAFGTGTHPTTALCLSFLDAMVQPEQTIVDYGCGSGILAISALKLGAKTAICIDNDPQALQATIENAKRNHIHPDRLITLPPERTHKLQADILVANILSNPLIQLAPKLKDLVKPHGHIALSGILCEQVQTVQHVYNAYFDLALPQVQESWVLLSGQKLQPKSM